MAVQHGRLPVVEMVTRENWAAHRTKATTVRCPCSSYEHSVTNIEHSVTNIEECF